MQQISRRVLGRRVDADGKLRELPPIHDGEGKGSNGSLDRVEKVSVVPLSFRRTHLLCRVQLGVAFFAVC